MVENDIEKVVEDSLYRTLALTLCETEEISLVSEGFEQRVNKYIHGEQTMKG